VNARSGRPALSHTLGDATNNGRTPPEENTVTASLFLGVPPANAAPAPEPVSTGESIWTCPTRIDAVAQVLRAQGFSAPAAKNFALFVKEDCVAIV
jgi:hypothetical protein